MTCGKDLELSKYDFRTQTRIQKTKECKKRGVIGIGFKSISLKVDKYNRIWMHDAISKSLLIFNDELEIIEKIKGNPIGLCKQTQKLNTKDYQEDITFDESRNTLLWYKGLGEIGLVDVKTIKEYKSINNAIRNPPL